MSLNLNDGLKRELFKINDKFSHRDHDMHNHSVRQDLVFLQHPFDGNLILTQNNLYGKYGDQITKKT